MKKTVKIEMYLDCAVEIGYRWTYVCSVWGDHIEIDNARWYLLDDDGRIISCGNVSGLHADGTDYFDIRFKNVVCY